MTSVHVYGRPIDRPSILKKISMTGHSLEE